MSFSLSALLAGFVFGVIGVYWIKRGKTEAHPLSMFLGVALLVYPYFIENVYLLWGIGAVICIAAYKLA